MRAKKHGVSKRLGKIRRGYVEALEAYIAAAERGDRQAYDRLYREYYAYVLEEAEDRRRQPLDAERRENTKKALHEN